MNDLARDLLRAGGVAVPEDSGTAVQRLEAWLDLPEASVSSLDASVEDDAPFSDDLYRKLGDLLCACWKPEHAKLMHGNVFIEHRQWSDPLTQSSLYDAMDAVRVTRLLRHWMDLNINGSVTVSGDDLLAMNSAASRPNASRGADGEGSEQGTRSDRSQHDNHARCTLTTKLLSVTADDHRQEQPRPLHPVVAALYYHIEQLPQLQSQIHLYVQHLSRPVGASQTTASRLEQYQAVQRVKERLLRQWDEHTTRLEFIVGDWYTTQSATIRRQCRAHMGRVSATFLASSGAGGVRTENTTSSGVQVTLRVLLRIIRGMERIDHRSCEHLLVQHLIPLHSPNSMVLWRDQTCLLELYHEPLVQCIAAMLQKKPAWIPKTIAAIIDPNIWPKTGGNTPKLILLLHEIDTYISILSQKTIEKDALHDTFVPLLSTLGRCMSSEHSQLAERALAYFRNKAFQALVEMNFEQSLYLLLPFLIRNEPSWNPTVRKMTHNVLKHFIEHDADKFDAVCDRVFQSRVQRPRTSVHLPQGTHQKRIQPSMTTESQNIPEDFSLKSAMGDWKPPSSSLQNEAPSRSVQQSMLPPSLRMPRKQDKGSAPPLSVTGVAPWAVNKTQLPPSSSPSLSSPHAHGKSSAKTPPLAVTGVAPWAVKSSGLSTKQTKRTPPGMLGKVSEDDGQRNKNTDEEQTRSGSDIVRSYMDKIKPKEEEHGSSTWAKAQMAETPTLLPNLKFHDLVFGHKLGHGAFGSVKYARLIDRKKTRSHWAEYAVKVVSTEKIKELGYEASVQREIAILRILSHPGIARLVSSFRFREGVYLVLEYASGGDLHTLLKKHGSLDEESTRFVIGELVATLVSIHEEGFVYGDLKPENVVITETGHVKLTDFGGCRPTTAAAIEKVSASSRNLLQQLRNGDWRPQTEKLGLLSSDGIDRGCEDSSGWGVGADGGDGGDPVDANVAHDDSDDMDTGMLDDLRIEGTIAYLPPEVVLGERPTPVADAWALGCVLYQCLSGRPPILEDDDDATRHKIVTFNSDFASDGMQQDQRSSNAHALFGEKHASGISTSAQQLILRCLNRMPSNRPSMHSIAQDRFFDTVDVFSLHRQAAHPLDVGEVAPVADAQWSRRQFSSIWAPQPKAYDIGMQPQRLSGLAQHAAISNKPIPEEEEIGSLFSKSILSTGLDCDAHSSELPPLPS